jgi:hypothetical protein
LDVTFFETVTFSFLRPLSSSFAAFDAALSMIGFREATFLISSGVMPLFSGG